MLYVVVMRVSANMIEVRVYELGASYFGPCLNEVTLELNSPNIKSIVEHALCKFHRGRLCCGSLQVMAVAPCGSFGHDDVKVLL
jgi:hypothetical protein